MSKFRKHLICGFRRSFLVSPRRILMENQYSDMNNISSDFSFAIGGLGDAKSHSGRDNTRRLSGRK